MSARSNISMELPNGNYKTIYCHFDGYPEHNGELLLNYYNTKDKVEKLLSMGNLSSLAEKIEPQDGTTQNYVYEQRQHNVCVFYNRDCGVKDQEAKELTLDNFKDAEWIEYFYIFTLNNEWKYYDYNFNTLYDLKKELEEMKIEESETLTKKHNSDEEM
ncbi:MAG: hypothetical protein RR247_04110 [Clostridia bacterium]